MSTEIYRRGVPSSGEIFIKKEASDIDWLNIMIDSFGSEAVEEFIKLEIKELASR